MSKIFMKGFYKQIKQKEIKSYKNKNIRYKKYKRKETKMKGLDDFTIDEWLGIFSVVAFFILILFIAPWINFWLAYFGGWVAKITIGKYIVEGFSLISITLPLNKIPLLAGTLGWIGSFFKNISNLKSNTNN